MAATIQTGNHPPLTRERQIELADRMRMGDKAAKDELFLSILPMLVKLTQRYPVGIRDEIFQQAALEFYAALDGDRPFDGRKGALATYAYSRVWWCAARFRTRLLTCITRPSAGVSNYSPGVQEQIARAGMVISLDEARDNSAEHGNNVEPTVEDDLHLVDESDSLATLGRALDELPHRWREILLDRVNGRPLADIARHHGLTKQRISQIEQAAFSRLRTFFGLQSDAA